MWKQAHFLTMSSLCEIGMYQADTSDLFSSQIIQHDTYKGQQKLLCYAYTLLCVCSCAVIIHALEHLLTFV